MEKWPTGLSPQALAQWLNEQNGEETLMNRLKMNVVEVGPERAVVEMPVHPGLYTPRHYIHAGVMVSLADSAATLASVAAYLGELEPEQLPVAVSIFQPDRIEHQGRIAGGRSDYPTSWANAGSRFHGNNRRRRPIAGLGQFHPLCPSKGLVTQTTGIQNRAISRDPDGLS